MTALQRVDASMPDTAGPVATTRRDAELTRTLADLSGAVRIGPHLDELVALTRIG